MRVAEVRTLILEDCQVSKQALAQLSKAKVQVVQFVHYSCLLTDTLMCAATGQYGCPQQPCKEPACKVAPVQALLSNRSLESVLVRGQGLDITELEHEASRPGAERLIPEP